MQQHPIPQNVTQYQFRLVGDMTLKQFLELALGMVLAYLFFASNLIFIFKWPLVILSLLLGVGLAFFPIEDRPLDQWIVNFIKAIYAPTRFTWQKTNKIPSLFLFTAHPPDLVTTITKTIKAPSSQVVGTPISDLSAEESTKITSLDSLFTSLPVTPTAPAPPKTVDVVKPSIVVRKLNPQSAVVNRIVQTPKTVPISIPKSAPNPTTVSAPPTTENIVFASKPTAPRSAATVPISSAKHITLPASPKVANLVTGVVVDAGDKLVPDAIVQIVSGDGIPQRAMKTNSLGQFYTSTPLGPGTYVIEVDKDGFSFPPQQLAVNNTILSPIELRASS